MITSHFFSTLSQHWKKELPFVVYRKPNTNTLTAQLQKTVVLEKVDYTTSGFIFAPFVVETDPVVWFSKANSEILTANFDDSKEVEYQKKFSNEGLSQNKVAAQSHIKIINSALKVLKDKALQKVVLSRVEVIEREKIDPMEYFRQLCISYPNTFCYCWYHPKVGMWLGATPETLIQLEQTSFKTMALAGTQTDQGQPVVVWGNKEQEEQRFVLESIISELKPFTKTIIAGETKTQKAGSLLHLKTDIQGTLQSAGEIKALINVLHPTPAVCGLPKQQAQEFILKNEGYNRKYYTGYLGLINPYEKSELFVNLRCMELEQCKIKVYIGGGITELSNPEDEWNETVNKSQIMKQVL